MKHSTTVARLLRLALHLETKVARKDFDIAQWPSCGMGHACKIPSFRRAGLRLVPGIISPVPEFLGSVGLHAAETFFGISRDNARHLFLLCSYLWGRKVTPKMVARRIRALVKTLNADLAHEKAKVAKDKPCRKPRRRPALAVA